MIVYMIQCDLGWYGPRGRWVHKSRARIWSNTDGVRSAKGTHRVKPPGYKVIEFDMTERANAP